MTTVKASFVHSERVKMNDQQSERLEARPRFELFTKHL